MLVFGLLSKKQRAGPARPFQKAMQSGRFFFWCVYVCLSEIIENLVTPVNAGKK